MMIHAECHCQSEKKRKKLEKFAIKCAIEQDFVVILLFCEAVVSISGCKAIETFLDFSFLDVSFSKLLTPLHHNPMQTDPLAVQNTFFEHFHPRFCQQIP